jgi:hypothetical protein
VINYDCVTYSLPLQPEEGAEHVAQYPKGTKCKRNANYTSRAQFSWGREVHSGYSGVCDDDGAGDERMAEGGAYGCGESTWKFSD